MSSSESDLTYDLDSMMQALVQGRANGFTGRPRSLAESGHVKAQLVRGILYQFGIGVWPGYSVERLCLQKVRLMISVPDCEVTHPVARTVREQFCDSSEPVRRITAGIYERHSLITYLKVTAVQIGACILLVRAS